MLLNYGLRNIYWPVLLPETDSYNLKDRGTVLCILIWIGMEEIIIVAEWIQVVSHA